MPAGLTLGFGMHLVTLVFLENVVYRTRAVGSIVCSCFKLGLSETFILMHLYSFAC